MYVYNPSRSLIFQYFTQIDKQRSSYLLSSATPLKLHLITSVDRENEFTMFVFFAALLSSASAAKFCCSPDQWEGDAGLVMGIVNQGNAITVEGTMRMSYDSVNRIVAYNQTLTVDGNPVMQRVVNDHKNNIMYTMTGNDCKRTVAAPWISGCIPDNATETASNMYYGLGDNSVKIKAYLIQYEGYEVYLAVTTDTCAPVSEVLTGNLEAITGQKYGATTETMESLVFANISPGIANREVFYIPAQCAPATGQAVGRRSPFVL
ncbi:uncharacterized protein LOC123562817 [Mercenaria mercenaria]|uniref:uncharacterized protein LOC123562817 n=1 Tax=Mercenaria mercenaria TaxID=6596 RepID=UPI00234FADD4|nr:uncharacterized protein LOC123562817 [Mercenaria mercenaria]